MRTVSWPGFKNKNSPFWSRHISHSFILPRQCKERFSSDAVDRKRPLCAPQLCSSGKVVKKPSGLWQCFNSSSSVPQVILMGTLTSPWESYKAVIQHPAASRFQKTDFKLNHQSPLKQKNTNTHYCYQHRTYFHYCPIRSQLRHVLNYLELHSSKQSSNQEYLPSHFASSWWWV